jgi:GntR family transcriptional repressor for pyruvate dehydrogenase complex
MERKREELVRQLVALIREPGRFPGGKLPPERDLARSLGVGRNLLREAIITLEAMGLLEIRERQGTFIRSLDGGEEITGGLRFLNLWPGDILIHLMEMRLVVEVPTAALAAVRRDETELERMRECVLRLQEVHDKPDCAPSGASWDTLLHAQMVNAARNPVLSRVYEGLFATMERYIVTSRTLLLSLEGWPLKVLNEHRRLVEALERRAPEAAQEAVRDHLAGALEKLSELRGARRNGNGSP